jgi:hypothetical protein
MMNRSMVLGNVGLFIRQALGALDKHLSHSRSSTQKALLSCQVEPTRALLLLSRPAIGASGPVR